MSIHQLPSCCYVFDDPAEDGQRHYLDIQDASAALLEAREANPETKASTRPLDYRCWVVECDGECGQALDEEDEGIVYHHESFAEAEETASAFEFRLVPGLLGEVLAYCPQDAPDGAEVPPPTPAQQEAAGQLSLLDAGAA